MQFINKVYAYTHNINLRNFILILEEATTHFCLPEDKHEVLCPSAVRENLEYTEGFSTAGVGVGLTPLFTSNIYLG